MQYLIEKGDTLTAIAKRYNTSVDEILAVNPQIVNRHRILAGDTIEVPMMGKFGKWLRGLFR